MAMEAAMAKPWRCRLGLHRWQRLRNPEGGWYRECRECGKQRNVSGSPPSMAGP
jgi:predicted cupin superfamily sugar epimerase